MTPGPDQKGSRAKRELEASAGIKSGKGTPAWHLSKLCEPQGPRACRQTPPIDCWWSAIVTIVSWLVTHSRETPAESEPGVGSCIESRFPGVRLSSSSWPGAQPRPEGHPQSGNPSQPLAAATEATHAPTHAAGWSRPRRAARENITAGRSAGQQQGRPVGLVAQLRRHRGEGGENTPTRFVVRCFASAGVYRSGLCPADAAAQSACQHPSCVRRILAICPGGTGNREGVALLARNPEQCRKVLTAAKIRTSRVMRATRPPVVVVRHPDHRALTCPGTAVHRAQGFEARLRRSIPAAAPHPADAAQGFQPINSTAVLESGHSGTADPYAGPFSRT